MDGQDWTPVVVNKGVAKAKARLTTGTVMSAAVVAMRRLESDEEPKKAKTLSAESKQGIIAGRVAKGWNQTQLNTQCAFPLNTVRDIENGRLTPTPQQLTVLSRVLKVIVKYG